jgi:glycosyltransferase involved in cell wall biosynthesis
MSKVSLFIPVFNASRLIRDDLRKCYDALLRLGNDFEIILVDDNSTDASHRFRRVIEKAKQATGREIKYLSYDKGPSRRENLARSFCAAKYDVIAFMDADLSCDVSFLLKAIDLLKKGSADIVTGSRYVKGARARRRPLRRIFSFFYNTALRILFDSRIKDHQCGLKVFRRDKVMPVIDEMGYDEKFVRGWFWDAELLIRAQKAALKIIEMPVEWHYADMSTFNFRRELRCLRSIAKLRKNFGRIGK